MCYNTLQKVRLEKMKKMLGKKSASIVASASKKMAQMTADTACIWWMHQPKLPEAVKKLRKF